MSEELLCPQCPDSFSREQGYLSLKQYLSGIYFHETWLEVGKKKPFPG